VTAKNLEADLVVVGGGGAGLAAACAAAENGCRKTIVLGKTGSAFNSGRIAGENAAQYIKKWKVYPIQNGI
jgi:succinate dehydrogenase/fumarate reductase flavoprotein subunit